MKFLLYFLFFFVFSFLFGGLQRVSPILWVLLSFTVPFFLATAISRAVGKRRVYKQAAAAGLSPYDYVAQRISPDFLRDLEASSRDESTFKRQLSKLREYRGFGDGEIAVIKEHFFP